MTSTSPARWLLDHRWPLGLAMGLLVSVGANVTLLYYATRPDASRPEPGYYQRSLHWDQEFAVVESSRELGWSVAFTVLEGPEYAPGMPRPVDFTVTDAEQQPVLGLEGTIQARDLTEARADNHAQVVELPQRPGAYRALLRFPRDGAWDLGLDLQQESTRFVASKRLSIRTLGEGP